MQSLSQDRLAILTNPQSLPAAAQVMLIVTVTLAEWDLRYRTRNALKRLNDDQLADIGLDRGTAYTEARRPFWRA